MRASADVPRVPRLSRRRAGLLLALASAVAFGGSGATAKPLIEAGLGPLHVVWIRVAGAALVLLPVAWRHRALARRRPALLAGFGLLSVAGVQAFYFAAIERVPVGVAILVEFLGPALLLGWIRFVQRRRVSRAAAVGVALAVAGMASVVEVWAGLAFDAVGLLLAFCAACCQVSYFLLADHGSEGDDPPDPLAVIAFGLLAAAVLLTVLARPWAMDWAVLGGSAALGERQVPALLLACWLVLVGTVLAYLTGVLAVRRLSPQVAGVVACLEAVLASVFAWVLLGENLGLWQILGGSLVLVGAAIAQRAKPGAAPAGPGAAAPGGADAAEEGGSAPVPSAPR
ncbi:EamA family transporter [Streptomyces marincola]|uniref:EamA family transporter n=1 Tax=Streptomyces marincola TaxID=2878388 RepID=A0A1W7CYM3_9ACTN|nr:EamA family transporter [Streptomyces marincola]ARQ69872.1 EamA family transporter [Streptomyces marincola]